MEIYSTEEQQEEAIKKAIKDNWIVVLVGAAIGLSAVYGWRYYDASQLAQQEADSDAYTMVFESASKNEGDIIAKSKEYISNHDNKSYTVMMAMLAAKEAVSKKDLTEATSQLQWAADNTNEASLKGVILLRLARVQAEQEQFSEALATLDKPMAESFAARAHELKGDVYSRQGEQSKALAAYQLAADKGGLEGNNGLQLKIDDLAEAGPAL
ncbi:MAG: putative negative regulator of RcsB-dependent stress response [Phenylobacterium sp.]|jgi:predicted negative regulator of RcsB-dependent stress response